MFLEWVDVVGVHSASLFSAVAARYAVDFGLVVFSVDYRKAPEHKAPAASLDALGVHKYIRVRPRSLTHSRTSSWL